MTVARHPTRESVLACVTSDWQTTHAIFRAWCGEDGERGMQRHVRDELRAEVFWVLDSLYVARRVEKRQVDEQKAEWRRRPTLPDGPHDYETTTVEAAAQFERNRAA